MMLATSSLPLFSPRSTPTKRYAFSQPPLLHSRASGPHLPIARFPSHLSSSPTTLTATTPVCLAYVSGPASDPIVPSNDDLDSSDIVQHHQLPTPTSAISWGLLWALLVPHKLRLLASFASLLGCSTCTLSMPIFSGNPSFSLVHCYCKCIVSRSVENSCSAFFYNRYIMYMKCSA